MTTDPAALALPPREPETPADLVWTPGHTTRGVDHTTHNGRDRDAVGR